MSERGVAEICRDADGVTGLTQGAVFSRSQSDYDLRRTDRSPSRESAVERERSVDDVDVARMEEYALLSAVLMRPPDAALLRDLSAIRADSTELGRAHAALAQAAETTNPEHLEREYFNLFIGLGRGELLPYGSYYLTGFLHERPLARLRSDLSEIGIVRAEQHYEPGRALVHGHRDGSFCAAGLKPGLQGITARGAETDGDGDEDEREGKNDRCTSRYSSRGGDGRRCCGGERRSARDQRSRRHRKPR
jgi:hypothetical protein